MAFAIVKSGQKFYTIITLNTWKTVARRLSVRPYKVKHIISLATIFAPGKSLS